MSVACLSNLVYTQTHAHAMHTHNKLLTTEKKKKSGKNLKKTNEFMRSSKNDENV